MDEAPKHTEILGFRRDAGVFVMQYGACDIFNMTDRESEKLENDIGEDAFWQDDWWSYNQDGAFRLEGDLMPTHWMWFPKEPKG